MSNVKNYVRKAVRAGCFIALALFISVPSLVHAQTPPPPDVQTDAPSNALPPRGTNTGAPSDAGTPPSSSAAGSARQDGSDIYGQIGYWVLSLFAWLTGVAGVILNATVYYTVVKMAQFVDGLPAIIVAWRVLRDIGNIALIFGFIAIGLATILDIQSYNAKKMLVKLVIVAVTVNFSLFAARGIIDIGNVFAYQFYSQIVEPDATFNVTDEGVSNAIMQMVGLQKYYDPQAIEQASAQTNTLQNNAVFAFILGSMLFLVAAFVMFSLAIMLIARFVILVFLMIASPLGFIGLIVPTMEKRARDWWSMLIAQSATAPVLLLMLLISITLMGSANTFTHNQANFNAFFGNTTSDGWLSTANMIIGFFISMGFLMASLIVAKQAGAFGANFAISSSRRALGFALAPVTRPTRSGANWAARKSLNAIGNAYEGTGAGRVIRGIPLIGKLADEGLAQTAGNIKNTKIDGKSYADRQKEVKHREHEVSQMKTIGELRNADDATRTRILQKMSKADIVKFLEGANQGERANVGAALSAERYSDIMKDDKVDHAIQHDLAHGRYADTEADLATLADPARAAQHPAATTSLKARAKAFTVRDLELMPPEALTNPALVAALSETQAEELTKNANNNVSAAIKQQIRDIRNARFSTEPSARAAFATMSAQQIAKLDGDIVTRQHAMDAMNANALVGVLQSGNLNTQQHTALANYIVNASNNPQHPEHARLRAHVHGNPIVAQALGLPQAPLQVTIAPPVAPIGAPVQPPVPIPATPLQQPLTPGSRVGPQNRPLRRNP